MGDHLFDKYGEKFKEGDIIFCEYEPGSHFYLIQSGHVKLTKVVEEREKILDILSEGDIFGEMAILEEAPRSATAVVYGGDLKVLNFNKASFEILLKSHPQMALKLLKTFSKRIFEAKRRLETLNFKDIETKVLDTVLMLKDQKGFEEMGVEVIELDVTDIEIADWCAVDLQKARKVLQKHVLGGKISIDGSKISIHKLSELTRYVYNRRKSKGE